jgi:hypothetical protein
MVEGSWFLVGLSVILLSTAAVGQHKGVCWGNSTKRTVTHYTCLYKNFNVLSTEIFGPNRKLIDLINLSLTKNSIRVVERDMFHDLKKLENLDLSGNLISSLDEDVFSKLKSLQQLDLSSNLLAQLPDRLFVSQNHLKTLLLQGNKLRTISVLLLTPLISITSLDLSKNNLLCDCDLRLSMLCCKDRMLDTEKKKQKQVSGSISQWTQLEFVNSCLEYPVPSVLSKSVTTPYTKPEDRVVADCSSYLVPLSIVGAVAFQFICFGLFLLYLRRRRLTAVSTTRGERSAHSDSSSSHNCQYDYIQNLSIYTKPQIPARPIQTVGDMGPVQVETCHNGHSGIHLKEPTMFGTDTACDSYEGHHMNEPESKKSHRNNQQPVRSGVDSHVSYDLPEYDNHSKMAVSNCNAINRSSDASVMVENSLYSD